MVKHNNDHQINIHNDTILEMGVDHCNSNQIETLQQVDLIMKNPAYFHSKSLNFSCRERVGSNRTRILVINIKIINTSP